MTSFAFRLKELRERKGITQAQLSDATKLTISAISKWERGRRSPSAYALFKLSRFFGVSADYLLGATDE